MSSRCLVVFLVLNPFVVSGCATIRHERALQREELLAQAGFEKKLAESEEQRRELRRLPPRKLVRVPLGTETRYVYADAEYCRCLHAGTEAAYEQFLHALTREFINNEYLDTATPDPVVSAQEMTCYEHLARESVPAPYADASLDWEAWDR